jgi:tetratricopeptide (TPR) repeat protein
MMIGENNKAIEDCNQAIHLDPNFLQAYFVRGFSYYKLGEFDRACSDWRKAL